MSNMEWWNDDTSTIKIAMQMVMTMRVILMIFIMVIIITIIIISIMLHIPICVFHNVIYINVQYIKLIKTHCTKIYTYSYNTLRVYHYNDVIMGLIASQITGLTIVYSIVIQTQITEIIKAPRHWPLCGEFTGERWIPRTNGQLRGKCFHLMTSSWWEMKCMKYA